MASRITIPPSGLQALGDALGDGPPSTYLRSYVAQLRAASVLVEEAYVDRHYLEEYAHYYARSFSPPSPRCTRYHVFTLEPEDLESAFEDACQGHADAAGRLQDQYLGFVVLRPLDGASIGRTVLRPLAEDGAVHPVVRKYQVHVAGLELSFTGLAFQQQDQGAAVCASTALWSALQAVARKAGHRTPTPHDVTQAADSPYPASHGLNRDGMARALHRLGYACDVIDPAQEGRAWFRAQLTASIDSGLPAILLLARQSEREDVRVRHGHAVTVTGYVASARPLSAGPPVARVDALPIARADLKTLIVHDDNLGPHAAYDLIDAPVGDDSKSPPPLLLLRGSSHRPPPADWEVDAWRVLDALVPKPPKLRMSISFLLGRTAYLRDALAPLSPEVELAHSARFATGIDVERSMLVAFRAHPNLKATLFSLGLPRNVGILSAWRHERHVVDVVVDATQVQRRSQDLHPLLALGPEIPEQSHAGRQLAQLAKHWGCALLLRV